MHHILIESWSRKQSFLHRRDARVKIVALLVFLVALATADPFTAPAAAGFAILLLGGVAVSALPVVGWAVRAAAVLPFSLTFAAVSWIAGDPHRAATLLAKSYFSACAVLLLVATTPMSTLFYALHKMGVPRVLILVLQFLYRYLFVVAGQAKSMWSAAISRGMLGAQSGRKVRFDAAAGMLAVLFARSYERAQGIQRAMMARGFTGEIPVIDSGRAGLTDVLVLLLWSAMVLAVRLGYRLSP